MTPSSGTSARDETEDAAAPTTRTSRSAPDYRRRRLVVGVVVVVVLVAGGLVLRAMLSGDDEGPAADPIDRVEVEPQDANDVLATLRESPCDLLVREEVEGVVQRSFAAADAAGGVCSYALDDGGTGSVAVQAFGPLTTDAFGALVADGVALEGTDPPAHLVAGGADARALALDGAVAVEVAVRLDLSEERQQEVAGDLIDLATSRVPRNERGDAEPVPGGGAATGDCPFLGTGAAELLDGADPQPLTNPDVCSFRTADGFITVERITEPTVGLADIRRSSGTGDEEQEWPREEVDVADGGVWLVPPGDEPTSGELYALDGGVLVHVSISAPDLDVARMLAVDLVGEVEK